MADVEELVGEFDWERNVFIDNDPERRTIVGLLIDGTVIKGKAKRGTLQYGLTYRFSGRWTNHPRWGRQFHFNGFTLSQPAGQRGVTLYLSRAAGIGPAIAEAIWDAFGDESLRILRDDPERVADAIPGLSVETAQGAADRFAAESTTESTMVELVGLLAKRGFPRTLPDRCFERWGASAPDVIREDPYVLTTFHGVGFLLCDRLYLELGGDPAAINRQGMCLWHAVRSDVNGHTWHLFNTIAHYLKQSISGADLAPEEALDWAVENNLLVTRTEAGCLWVAEARLAAHEMRIADCVRESEFETPIWPSIQWSDDEDDGLPTRHQAEELAKAQGGVIGILLGSPGTGKAQPLDAKVLTPGGWTTMGNLSPGDLVIGALGKPIEVLAVYDQGEKDVYRIEMSDGSFTECCDEHLWQTTSRRERQRRRRQGSIKRTSEIRKTLDRGDGSPNHAIPLVSPPEFSGPPLPVDPYVLGVLIGDGCFRSGSITISTPDVFVINECRRLDSRIEFREVKSGERCRTWTVHGIKHHLRNLGLAGALSIEKHIPTCYLFGTPEERSRLLQGLLDTDGHTSEHTLEYSTSSKQLCDDFRQLVWSLGGLVTVSERMPKYQYNGEVRVGAKSYRILVKLPHDIEPFRLPRKQDAFIPKTKYMPRRYVLRIDSVGCKRCRCISVNSPDGLYVTDDYIVTHNTYTVAHQIKAVGANPARVAVCAPTGKAAVRITESMAHAGLSLQAKTIHSTLGVVSVEGGWVFAHNERCPLEFDYIFVDEASMIDVPLMSALLAARGHAHVMFIGDPDQLSPVGPGAPLRDLVAAGVPHGHLKEIHRNAGTIVRACAMLRDKGTLFWDDELDLSKGKNLIHIETAKPEQTIEEIRQILAQAEVDGRDPVWDCQVLVPVNKKSPLGRTKLNEWLQGLLNPAGKQVKGNPFREQDKIVCTRNGDLPKARGDKKWADDSKQVRVMNGELAEVTQVSERYLDAKVQLPPRDVRIPRGQAKDQNGDGDDDTDTGCNFELGYSLSVHKAQGSQFPVVIVVIDSYPGARMLCDRHWIYTAISRATDFCITIGHKAHALDMCRKSHMWKRRTFLREMIDDLRCAEFIHKWEGALKTVI